MIKTSTNTTRPAQIGLGMPGLWVSTTPTVHAVNIPRMFPSMVMASARESPPVWKKHPQAITAAQTRLDPSERKVNVARPPRRALLKDEESISRMGSLLGTFKSTRADSAHIEA